MGSAMQEEKEQLGIEGLTKHVLSRERSQLQWAARKWAFVREKEERGLGLVSWPIGLLEQNLNGPWLEPRWTLSPTQNIK